jgi:hypothetical protein
MERLIDRVIDLRWAVVVKLNGEFGEAKACTHA